MRLRALDGWRGVGALAVAILHFQAMGFFTLAPPLESLTLAVDFFFVLSGFVIARTYADALAAGSAWAGFVIRRFGRLWPLHALLITAMVAVDLVATVQADITGVPAAAPMVAHPPGMILPNLLLVQTFLSSGGLSWNFPSWSISAEFWTYVLFALVVAGPARGSGRAVLFAAVALLALAVIGFGAPNGMENTGDFGLARCIAGFFLGTLTEGLLRRPAVQRLSTGWLEAPAALVALLLVLAATMVPAVRFAAPLVFAGLVLAHAGDGGPLSRLLMTAPLQWLGRHSYSIYMTHALVLGYGVPGLDHVIGRLLPASPVAAELLTLALYLTAVAGLSALTWRFVERPGQRVFAALAQQAAVRR